MAKLSDAKSVKIGVKFDQPGIGYKKPGTDTPEGFDIEIAKIVAAKLGIEPGQIEWVETVSKNREPFLQNGTVDMVIASYSITDERREIVGQAGPYYVTGQQLLVRKDDSSITGPDALTGKKVCSVTGSTSIKTVQEKYGAAPVPFATYTECVQQLLNKLGRRGHHRRLDPARVRGAAAGQAEGRRRAVQRGAVRDRLQEGRRRVLHVPQRHAERRVRRRGVADGVRGHAGQGRRRDAGQADAGSVLVGAGSSPGGPAGPEPAGPPGPVSPGREGSPRERGATTAGCWRRCPAPCPRSGSGASGA